MKTKNVFYHFYSKQFGKKPLDNEDDKRPVKSPIPFESNKCSPEEFKTIMNDWLEAMKKSTRRAQIMKVYRGGDYKTITEEFPPEQRPVTPPFDTNAR